MARLVFTGLIQTQGRLLVRSARSKGYRLAVGHDFGPLELGESIAVNGVCLTVTTAQGDRFEADASAETVARSTLGRLAIGRTVHLERALRVGDRLGGHIVSGHVDATTQLIATESNGDASELVFELPPTLVPFIAEKGSIAIDGASLTINRTIDASFSVMVVPHTLTMTHLGSLRRGDVANVEVDVLARYIVHLVRVGNPAGTAHHPGDNLADRDASLRDALARAGFS